MSEPPVQLARGPKRAQAQRERILAAAKKCFVEHGFHAASMGDIAHEAGMSPGLIYRYYDSKSTIIVAIIERQLEESRVSLRELNSATDFAEALLAIFIHWCERDTESMNAALFAEMSAEATRDPALAAAVLASDQAVREELCRWLSARAAENMDKGLPEELAKRRALTLQCFIQGLAVRALREPAVDHALMRATIVDFVHALFAMPDQV